MDRTCGYAFSKSSLALALKKNTTLKVKVSRLKAELKRANEERDILKKAATYFGQLSG